MEREAAPGAKLFGNEFSWQEETGFQHSVLVVVVLQAVQQGAQLEEQEEDDCLVCSV